MNIDSNISPNPSPHSKNQAQLVTEMTPKELQDYMKDLTLSELEEIKREIIPNLKDNSPEYNRVSRALEDAKTEITRNDINIDVITRDTTKLKPNIKLKNGDLKEKTSLQSLKLLNREIEEEQTPPIDKIDTRSYFKANASFKDKIRILFEKFKSFFLGKIQESINKQIFYTWNQKLRFEGSLKEIVKLNREISKLEKVCKNTPNNKRVIYKLNALKSELVRTEKFVAEYESNLIKARETRIQFQTIGGERLALETKDNEILDATYLDAGNFQKKCSEAGAKQVKISVPVNGANEEISGLIIPKGGNGDSFLKTLEQLKLFRDFNEDLKSNKGCGWTKLHIGDQIAIIPDFEVERLLEAGAIQEKIEDEHTNEEGSTKITEVSYSFSESISQNIVLETNELEIDPKKSGTVVMGLGAAGVYEMAKREALSLLMQGSSVMLFNHRGQGESSGKPSEKGSYEDMETVYQYLKQTRNIPDEKLVFRGLCLSGGIVSELASRHPKINIILDQTYADISDICFNTVLDSVKDLIGYSSEDKDAVKEAILFGLAPLLRLVASSVSPDFQTAKNLKNFQGRILILRATEDSYTGKEMTDKIIGTLAETLSAEQSKRVLIGHMPGMHGSNWLDARMTHGVDQKVDLGRYHIMSFLEETGALNSFIDKGSSLLKLSSDFNSYLDSQAAASVALMKAMEALPESIENLPEDFVNISSEDIRAAREVGMTESSRLDGIINGKEKFNEPLQELERLKDRLGGSPTFGGSKPKLDDTDSTKKFFGLPLSAVQDWFAMTIRKGWNPKVFWKSTASLFQVSLNKSQYEEAHISIQRFGMLISNKERFIEILENNRQDSFSEFGTITGLAWHPNSNGSGTEKMYIEFIEKFLTENFEAAKSKGDDALVEYFNAFQGVCFEDRCRHLEQFAIDHPTDAGIAEIINTLDDIIDIDFNKPPNEAFNAVAGDMRSKEKDVNLRNLFEEVKKNDLFNKEFLKDGSKIKPTLKDFHDYAIDMIDLFVFDAGTIEDILEFEFEFLENSSNELTVESFKAHLIQLDGKNIVGDEHDPFSIDDPAIDSFINKKFT